MLVIPPAMKCLKLLAFTVFFSISVDGCSGGGAGLGGGGGGGLNLPSIKDIYSNL